MALARRHGARMNGSALMINDAPFFCLLPARSTAAAAAPCPRSGNARKRSSARVFSRQPGAQHTPTYLARVDDDEKARNAFYVPGGRFGVALHIYMISLVVCETL